LNIEADTGSIDRALEYSTTNYEDPLFLTLHPLDDLIRAMGEACTGHIWPSNAVKLEVRARPGQ
jgi:hypothetical protein